MFRIDDPSAANALPTPEAAGTPGYFTEGNPSAGDPATLVRASFLNMLQEEVMSVLTAAGVTPSKTAYNQLLTSINNLITNAFATKSTAANGYQKLPGGIIFQWLNFTQSDVTNTATAYSLTLPTAFPNACRQAFISIASGIAAGGVVASVEGLFAASVSGFTYSPDTSSRAYRIFAIGY